MYNNLVKMPKALIKKNTRCLICKGKQLTHFLSLGDLPLANSYLTKKELKKRELKIPLDIYFCHTCHLAQLLDIVDRRSLFNNYAYFSSASSTLVEHFEEYAQALMKKFPKLAKQLIIDVGSNDGVLLKPLKKLGARILGVDPATNITTIVNKEQLETINDFFGTHIVSHINNTYGKAGIITANNVLAHTDKIHDIMAATKQILDPKGVFIFEIQYLADLIRKNEFDGMYHEHICYFSLHPLTYLLEQYDLQVFDVLHVDNHGGSLRIYASHKSGPFRVKKSVQKFLQKEQALKLHEEEIYKKFAKQPLIIRKTLTRILADIKKQGKKIMGYGAPAKATTLLNFCGITKETIDYITDSTPSKQNLFMPGNHIPILAPEQIKKNIPDYIIILAWNSAETIMKKEQWFTKQGGKFILPIPYPTIIG